MRTRLALTLYDARCSARMRGTFDD